MPQSKSNDTLQAGCAVFIITLAIFGLVCGGCLLSGVSEMSRAVDAAKKAAQREVEAEQKQRAAEQAPVKQAIKERAK